MGWSFFSRNQRQLGVERSGYAARVVFLNPGESGTYLDGAWVRIYQSGVVDVNHPREQVTTHIQNVEIIWKSQGQQKPERSFVLHSFDSDKRGKLRSSVLQDSIQPESE